MPRRLRDVARDMSTVDEVKLRLDVVDVVGGYVGLTKAGRNFKALCPFHQEKTPSFYVFPDRQSWRCFGCGAGGDVIAFVMKREGMDFSDALKSLADRAGVPIERAKDRFEPKPDNKPFEANREAAAYYHSLLADDPSAKATRDYLARRGIGENAQRDFELGYSSGQGLKKHLAERGFTEKDLLAVGLLRETEGATYEFFRNRLMFPIRDIKGRVVGFGARALDDTPPKYINTQQTAVFDKSAVLYGVDLAKGAIRESKQAIIMEGYTDVIMAHQHGAANVVASMGTALSEKQVKALKSLTRNLVLALDPDVAGDAATLRGIEVARRSLDRDNLEVPNPFGGTSRLRADIRILPLPRGKDPADVIREDPDSWQSLVESAVPLVDHLITVVTSKVDVSKPEGKSMASEQLLPVIAELESDLEREHYFNKLAGILGVTERKLAEISATMHQPKRKSTRRAADRAPQRPTAYRDPLEECCLSLLLQHSELRERAVVLTPEHFEHSENRELFVAWSHTSGYEEMHTRLGTELHEHLESVAASVRPPGGRPEAEAELAACLCRLEERRLRIEQEAIALECTAAIQNGVPLDSEELSALRDKQLDINAKLVEKMHERTGQSLLHREDQ